MGDSFTVEWLLADGNSDANGNVNNTGQAISAEAVFELAAFDTDSNYIDLRITATNTTASNDDEVGLWKIGFGTNPEATAVGFYDDDDGEFINATSDSLPGLTSIEVVSNTDPGKPKNLQAGESDAFNVQVSFSDLTESSEITLDPFGAFFQSDPDSFQVLSDDGNGNEVPAPAPLVLLGIGIGMLGLFGSRLRG